MATLANTGIASAAGLLNGEVTNYFEYLALGTDNTAESASHTALQAEITTNGGSRASATCSQVTTTVTNDTAQWVHTWSFTGTLAIYECGVLDSASSGIMLLRHVFSTVKNVGNGDSLELTVKVQVAEGS